MIGIATSGPSSSFINKEGIATRKKGGGALFARQGLFFLLDSQVIRIFCLKNRLIILRAVTYVMGGSVFELRGINQRIIG